MTTGTEHGTAARAVRRFEAVVFDFDGVIVDTERIVHQVWAEMFARYGCSFSLEEWGSVVGSDHGFDPYRALSERSSMPLPALSAIRAEIEGNELALCRDLSPLPGVRDWLEGAADLGMKVAVASSSPLSWVGARLADVGLDRCFSVLSCRDARLAAKPAPDLYLDACARLGVETGRAIAVEDSGNGLAAARAAGLACVAVPNVITAGHDLAGADLVLGSLADATLLEAVRTLSEKLSA